MARSSARDPRDETPSPAEGAAEGKASGREARTINIGAIVLGVLAVAVIAGGLWLGLEWRRGASSPSDSPELATVNGVPITEHDVDVELAIQRGVQAQKGRQLQDDADTVRAFRRELVDQLVDDQLLVQAAESVGINVGDEAVSAELPALGEEFAVDMEALRQFVLDAGVSEADYEAWARRGITVRKYLETEEAQDIGLEALRDRGTSVDQGIFVNVAKDDVASGLQRTADIRFFSDAGADTRAAVEGEPAPDFALADVNGNLVSLSDFRGQPVMVNFWATWCEPCAREMPMFHDVQDANSGNGLVVLTVNVQEPPDEVREHLAETGWTLPVVLDRDGQVSTIYRVRGLPSTFFIAADGVLVEAKRGALTSRTDLAELIHRIMPEAEVFRSQGELSSES